MEGCDSIAHLELALSYSPKPGKVQPCDSSTVWSAFPDPDTPDTAYVVTNTEFFSFRYVFEVKEA